MKWILTTLLFTVIYISSYGQGYDINFNDTTYVSRVFIDTVNCHHNLWQVGRPHKTVFDSASSATNVIITDTSLPYAANDTSIFILKVPSYYGGPISTLSPILYSLRFNYWLNLGSTAKATIEFSVDDGLTWKDLLKDSVHYLEWDGSDGYHVRPSFDTSTHGWRQLAVYSENLSYGSPSDTTLFRFTFLSGDNDSARDGWMIDNMQIGYYSEGVDDVTTSKQLNTFPNPATRELSISSATGSITSVAISNFVGQTLYSNNYYSEKQVPVDVSKFPVGAYVIKINGTYVRRFIKQ